MEVSDLNEVTNENERLLKRIHNAIRHCIDFRYIHRLYQIKFIYRYYPLSNQILLIKSQLEKEALNQYQEDLEEFEINLKENDLIDDDKCQSIFDEYICLQRNYYYMIKLMNKKNR